MCSLSVYGQSPGGISSPELWFQTMPAGTGTKWDGNHHWVDLSGDSLKLNIYDEKGASSGEEFVTGVFRSYNGHPALSMDKLLDTKTREVFLKRTNLSQATVFGVFAPILNFDSEMLLYGLNGRPGQGVFVSNDKIYPSNESGKTVFDYGETEGMDLRYSSGDSETEIERFIEKSIRIVTYYRSLPPVQGIWGERDKAVFSFGYYRNSNANNTSAFSIPIGANRQFTGYIPEFIAYNRLLTPMERRQVDSYLAIKYGLSLPVSYLGSSGQLLWDYDANAKYGNRVTAIYRDNASGLSQLESSTSYEESPNYSYLSSNDFYYLNNPNNRTSPSRLLVVGREYGNTLANGSYLFWGDDGAPVKLREIEGVLGMKIMDRKWLLQTNIQNAQESERILEWETKDLDFNTSGFVNTIEKTVGSSAPEMGYAYTKQPLVSSGGYLGLDYSNIYGKIYLKFGAQGFSTAGGYDYGYFIDSDYSVYPIVKGVVSGSSFAKLIMTSRLEVEKRGSKIFLRINGSRSTDSEITIQAEDENNPWYASAAFGKGALKTTVNLRHGGFVDTGNRVELSYGIGCASDFKDQDKGIGFLVIDRSGSGNFEGTGVEYVKADEVDKNRQKMIFNNVFFDTDGSGSDVVTFAYRESDLMGDIEIKNPDCHQSNGEATIKLTSGKRAFIYTLTDANTGEVIREGRENSYTIHLPGLAGGEYDLKVQEAGGINIEGGNPAGTPSRARTTNSLPVFQGTIEWMVINTEDTYSIGYTTIFEDIKSSKNIIQYGLKKQGNTIYKYYRGKLEATNMTVEKGDVLTIKKTIGSKVQYYKNGVEFTSNGMYWLDAAKPLYALADMSEGPAELLNVDATGFFDLATYGWDVVDGMEVSRSDGHSLTYRFALTDPCGLRAGTATGVEAVGESANRLTAHADKGSYKIKARLELANEQAVTFVAYNMQGQLVAKQEKTIPGNIQEADLTVPTAGVYIVKALTATSDYTQKIMIK